MSRNGTGTYSLPAGNPVVTGTAISSSTMNTTLSDIASALTASIANDGQTALVANLPMGGFKLTGLGDATVANDAIRYNGALGTPSSGVATNLTGTAAGLTAGNATTAATCSGNAATATNATNASQLGGVAAASYARNGNNSDINTMTAVTSISATGGTAVKGTNTNNSAAAGYMGEYIESTLAVGSAVSLTSGVTSNVTSISLTAGDWDVSGIVLMDSGATTNVTRVSGGINSTSATIDVTKGYYNHLQAGYVPGGGQFRAMPLNTSRFSLASTTTIYLLALANFTVSTCTAYGTIIARRAR
jgi:hypothetical protein